MPDTFSIHIDRLGREGDGVADTSGGPVFIPNALPGETFVATADGRYTRTSPASAARVEPPCPHFGACGGCSAQHLAPDLYRSWKTDLLVSAFRTQKIDIECAPLLSVPPGSRRRAALTARVAGDRVVLGFHGLRSHTLIDLEACAVLLPAITEALPALRAMARRLVEGAGSERKPVELRFAIAALPSGLDVAIDDTGTAPNARAVADLAALARRAGLSRLTVEDVTVAAERTPELVTEAGAIPLPPGAFFQAVAEAEAALTAQVLAGVGKAKRVADLFSGAGTFALPLAKKARVLAIDSDRSLLGALQAAARKSQGLKPIETRVRDLFAEPLSPLELADVDAVVLDPPRAGAKAQAEAIARSKVKWVVAVSCNPATLARDCRILLDSGFRMGAVHGVDQFLWSPHLETVVALSRS